MKLLIASDIHGNLLYTKKLITLINKYKPDNLIILGDILSSYSYDDNIDPYEVANLLNKYSNIIISVRGNCDREENNLLYFDNNQVYKTLLIDDKLFYLTHGHLINNLDFIKENDYVLSGHTHIPLLSKYNINPGSIGLPRGGYPPTCLLYEKNTFKLINLDENKIMEEMELM